MKPIKKIVVRGLNWLGDVIMSTPALLRLRERYPEAEIVIVTPEKLADLYTEHSAVTRTMHIPKGASLLHTAGRIRQEGADLGIILPNSYRSALELFLARIPQRVGIAGSGRSMLLTKAVSRTGIVKMRKRTPEEIKKLISANTPPFRYPVEAHHIHHYLRIVAGVGADSAPLPPVIAVSESEIEAFRTLWNVGSSKRWIGLNVGAEYGPAKRWFPERFAETAALVAQDVTTGFIIFGGAGDIPLATELAGRIRAASPAEVVQVTGKTTLRELAAGMKLCALIITNDTGPMHLAAAVGTKVAAIFGSTSPELTGPGLPGSIDQLLIRSTVPCTPCFLRECPIDFRCMKEITPAMVAGAVRSKF